MARILLVEDDQECQFLVQKSLDPKSLLIWAKDLNEASTLIEQNNFDLIILDVTLPDGDGFAYCAGLQRDPRTANVPIIMLTGMTGTNSRTHGFSVGADDYVEKPFHPTEFRARIENKLHRWRQRKSAAEETKIGNIEVNFSSCRAFLKHDDSRVDLKLTPIEFKLLSYLLNHVDQIVSRNQLLDSIWGAEVNVTDRTVDKHISSLRRKMDNCSNYIQTANGFGYIFSPPPALRQN